LSVGGYGAGVGSRGATPLVAVVWVLRPIDLGKSFDPGEQLLVDRARTELGRLDRPAVGIEAEVPSNELGAARQPVEHREGEQPLRHTAEAIEQRSVDGQREGHASAEDEEPAERDHRDTDAAIQL